MNFATYIPDAVGLLRHRSIVNVDESRSSAFAMPLGIIDTVDDGPLAGTELLVSDARTEGSLGIDDGHLKRVMYKVMVGAMLA